jgi:hypothetical protein
MSELSPELRELVLATKGASYPSAADSARVFQALRARLGDAAVVGAETSQVAATGTSSGVLLGKVSAIGLAGLAVLGGLWLFKARHHGEALNTTNPALSATETQSASMAFAANATSSNVGDLPEPAASGVGNAANPTPDRAESRPLPSRRARDRLAEEVALLSRAETALQTGKPGLALEALNEHERQFGSGLLKEERIAARVQALCALGRTAEANAQMAQLSPKSLHGEQSVEACRSRNNR